MTHEHSIFRCFYTLQECAEHFGKCSVKELKHLKEGRITRSNRTLTKRNFLTLCCVYSGVHQKRIQSVVFGDERGAHGEAVQQRIIEEELSLQLSLLEEEFPPAYLFSSEEEDVNVIQDSAMATRVKEAERNHFFVELEEGILESLVICGVLGLMMLAPQLF